MKSESNPTSRMATAAELHVCGLAMMRQRLAREGRDLLPEVIERKFHRWLFREDDPVPGDVAGPIRTRASSRP